MKITRIRDKQNKKLTLSEVETITAYILCKLGKAGFITEGTALGVTSIKIGQHMRSFSLDLRVHDRNLQCNPYLTSKLTNLPTWDQRVEFNNIINTALNKFKVSANIKSGPYIIRQGFECMNEENWHAQKPDWIRSNEIKGYYIMLIDEKHYIENRRHMRNKKLREKRKLQNENI